MTSTRLQSNTSIRMALILAVLLLGAFAVHTVVKADQANGIKVGLITGSPILMDDSFNEMAYAGLLRAKNDLGIEETVYLSLDSDAIETNLTQCSADGNAICIMVGFAGQEATYNAAQANPTTNFAILDVSYDDYPPNLQGVVFASEEAAYLAGTLAGKMTESDKVGMIGGMDILPVNVFLCGFLQGTIDANPKVAIITKYSNDFSNPDMGAEIAQDMLDEGADVIFPAAGGTGSGALLTSTQAGAWSIGVDSDQYLTVFGSGSVSGADHMLTSAMKRLDNAVFQVISETVSAAFVSGTSVYDLAGEGVGLAPFHDSDPFIPADVKAAVEVARSGLIAGSIDPLRSCGAFKSFQPIVINFSQP